MKTQENEARLYYTRRGGDKNHSAINRQKREHWLAELNDMKRVAICRLMNISDQDNSLLGLRLLKFAAADLGLKTFSLADIVYPESGKPYWSAEATLDFSISHSGDLVLVVVSKGLQVGVDAEKIRSLKSLAFKSVMRPDELVSIKKQPELFFSLWSIKEAVVKAANCAGLSRMKAVNINRGGKSADFDNQCWAINMLSLDPAYCIALASSEVMSKLVITQLEMEDL